MMRMLNQRLLCSRNLPALLMVIFSLLATMAQGQQKQIRGAVKDGKGNPVPSVTVSVKGTSLSTVTADDGSFSINAKEGDVIVFTSVSFEASEAKVTSSSSYSVTLNSS